MELLAPTLDTFVVLKSPLRANWWLPEGRRGWGGVKSVKGILSVLIVMSTE